MSYLAPASISRSARTLPWPTFLLLGMWTWAIWSCAEHWQGNPNYSYGWAVPPLALGFGLRRYWKLNHARPPGSYLAAPMPAGTQILAAVSFGGLVFLLEYSREQMWHPRDCSLGDLLADGNIDNRCVGRPRRQRSCAG